MSSGEFDDDILESLSSESSMRRIAVGLSRDCFDES